MAFPIYSIPIVNSIAFGSYECLKTLLKWNTENMNNMQHLQCGAFAGLMCCIAVTPSEMVKCKLQMQFEDKLQSKYKGVYDCVVKEYKQFGIKGLYRGNVITMLRELPGYAAQFAGYNYIITLCDNYNKTHEKKIPYIIEKMVGGGVGGMCCWITSYPQDVVKTYLQTAQDKAFRHRFFDGGSIECSKEIYRKHGIYGFWRGVGVCMVRAFYANAFLFYFFYLQKDFLEKHLKGKGK